MSDETMEAVQQRHHTGRWVIAYVRRGVNCDNPWATESIGGISYSSKESAQAEIDRMRAALIPQPGASK
jgi:hypothetical protein